MSVQDERVEVVAKTIENVVPLIDIHWLRKSLIPNVLAALDAYEQEHPPIIVEEMWDEVAYARKQDEEKWHAVESNWKLLDQHIEELETENTKLRGELTERQGIAKLMESHRDSARRGNEKLRDRVEELEKALRFYALGLVLASDGGKIAREVLAVSSSVSEGESEPQAICEARHPRNPDLRCEMPVGHQVSHHAAGTEWSAPSVSKEKREAPFHRGSWIEGWTCAKEDGNDAGSQLLVQEAEKAWRLAYGESPGRELAGYWATRYMECIARKTQ